MNRILRRVPRELPRAFSLRDIEHHITITQAPSWGTNPSRTATYTLQHWLKNKLVISTGQASAGACGVPLYRRAGHR